MARKSTTATLLALSALLPFAVAAEEPVATLEGFEGTVMIDRGERYVNAKAGDALVPGDRLMILAGAKASVVFADGCRLPLDENTVAVVPQQSTCAGATAEVRSYGPMYAQAVGSTATDAQPEEDDDDDKAVWWWVAGGAVLAYGLYEVLDDDKDDGERPISP